MNTAWVTSVALLPITGQCIIVIFPAVVADEITSVSFMYLALLTFSPRTEGEIMVPVFCVCVVCVCVCARVCLCLCPANSVFYTI